MLGTFLSAPAEVPDVVAEFMAEQVGVDDPRWRSPIGKHARCEGLLQSEPQDRRQPIIGCRSLCGPTSRYHKKPVLWSTGRTDDDEYTESGGDVSGRGAFTT